MASTPPPPRGSQPPPPPRFQTPRSAQPPPPQSRQPPPPQTYGRVSPPSSVAWGGAPPAIARRVGGQSAPEGDKSYVATVVLSYLFGMFGADRFYLGKTRSALVKLFTLGGFGYWWLIDLLITLFGGQRDVWGLRLRGYEQHKKTVWIALGALFGVSLVAGLIALVATASVGESGPTPFGWVLLSTAAAAAAIGGVVVLVRRRAARIPSNSARRPRSVPPSIWSFLERFAALRAEYVTRSAGGDDIAGSVVQELDSLTSNTSELFTRLAAKSEKSQRDRARREYEDKLGKLTAALEHDYLLDILASPRLWDDPEQRISDVRAAIAAVDAQLLANVRQVNARKGIVFTVAIDGLIGPRKAMDDWQRDFDRAARDGDSSPTL